MQELCLETKSYATLAANVLKFCQIYAWGVVDRILLPFLNVDLAQFWKKIFENMLTNRNQISQIVNFLMRP